LYVSSPVARETGKERNREILEDLEDVRDIAGVVEHRDGGHGVRESTA